MSDQDRQLLQKAGLSAAKAAEMLQKSRQAISKGVRGEADYFTESDMLCISDRIGAVSPTLQVRLQNAIAEIFGGLADRMRAQAETLDLFGALRGAERAWLVFPDFARSRQVRFDDYEAVLACVTSRVPERKFDKAKPFEVMAFCDTFEGRSAVENVFVEEWFRRKRFAVIQCELVATLPPMIVIDPHKPEGRLCYVLSANGFVSLGSLEAAGWANAFGAAVSRKYGPPPQVAALKGEKPFNIINADVAAVLDAEARIVETELAPAA